jgi:beta-lactamase class A
MASLNDRLQSVAERFSGRFTLYAEHLETGEVIRFGTVHPMETASLIKLPIMVEALRQVEQGRLALSDLLTLEAADQVTGSGILQHMSPGDRLPLADVLLMMITISDNSATNLVLRTVGLSSVNTTMASLGLAHTRVLKRIDWALPGPIGYSVPEELAWLLKEIHRRRLISSRASDTMWHILERQQYNTLLTRHLPYDLLVSEDDATPPPVRIGSKSGSVEGVRNDAGLVLTPWGNYVIAIMSEGCQDLRFHVDNEAMVLLPDVSRAVFDHFVGTRRDGRVN